MSEYIPGGRGRPSITTAAIALTMGLFTAGPATARQEIQDLGFRFLDGKCVNDAGEEGLNPGIAGMCGDLKGADLRQLPLEGVDFSGANLIGARMNHAKLRGAIFHGANLNNSDMRNADVREAAPCGEHDIR